MFESDESMRESQRPVLHFGGIHQSESLGRDGGSLTEFAGIVRARLIECFEERVAEAAKFFGIEAAAIALAGEGIGFVNRCGAAHDLQRLGRDFLVDVGLGGQASDFKIHFATGDECGVAEFFGRETARKEGGVEFLIGIEFPLFARGGVS